jgi:adenosylcobinamide-phosphate guanylyltransferase
MAGGKGTRMGSNAIEKPMQIVGGKPVVMRVVEAMQSCNNVDKLLVSVSSNTPNTERFLQDMGVETICTSGNDFMEDLHCAFGMLNTEFVVTCPSDLPLIRSYTVDTFIDFFRPDMESAIAVVDKNTVINNGIVPSFTCEIDSIEWVLSGLCISDRVKTLMGKFLKESYMKTDWVDLAINVNTPHELALSRGFFEHCEPSRCQESVCRVYELHPICPRK